MFERLTEKEQLKRERAKNAQLLMRQQEQEDALFDLAERLSEVKNGETVSK